MLIEVDKLKEEVAYLSKRLRIHKETSALKSNDQQHFLGLNRRDSLEREDALYFKSDKLSLLLKWCKSVCAHYDVKVSMIDFIVRVFDLIPYWFYIFVLWIQTKFISYYAVIDRYYSKESRSESELDFFFFFWFVFVLNWFFRHISLCIIVLLYYFP